MWPTPGLLPKLPDNKYTLFVISGYDSQSHKHTGDVVPKFLYLSTRTARRPRKLFSINTFIAPQRLPAHSSQFKEIKPSRSVCSKYFCFNPETALYLSWEDHKGKSVITRTRPTSLSDQKLLRLVACSVKSFAGEFKHLISFKIIYQLNYCQPLKGPEGFPELDSLLITCISTTQTLKLDPASWVKN